MGPKGSDWEADVIAFLDKRPELWAEGREWRILFADDYRAHCGPTVTFGPGNEHVIKTTAVAGVATINLDTRSSQWKKNHLAKCVGEASGASFLLMITGRTAARQ